MDPYYPLPPPTLDELVQAATNALPSSHYLAAPSLSLNSLTMPSSSPSRPQTPLLPTPTHLRASTSLSASVGPTSNPRRNPNSNHPPRRRRTTPWELHILETAFAREPLPSQVQRQQIADSIGMTARACQVWFQNRRQKEKRDRETGLVPIAQDPPLNETGSSGSETNSLASASPSFPDSVFTNALSPNMTLVNQSNAFQMNDWGYYPPASTYGGYTEYKTAPALPAPKALANDREQDHGKENIPPLNRPALGPLRTNILARSTSAFNPLGTPHARTLARTTSEPLARSLPSHAKRPPPLPLLTSTLQNRAVRNVWERMPASDEVDMETEMEQHIIGLGHGDDVATMTTRVYVAPRPTMKRSTSLDVVASQADADFAVRHTSFNPARYHPTPLVAAQPPRRPSQLPTARGHAVQSQPLQGSSQTSSSQGDTEEEEVDQLEDDDDDDEIPTPDGSFAEQVTVVDLGDERDRECAELLLDLFRGKV